MHHIFVATPCYGSQVTLRYFHSIIDLIIHGVATRMPVTVETVGGDSLITRARNALVAKFLAHGTATHLMFIDADIGFQPAHVAGLLALDVDIAACMYPLKQYVWDDTAVARAKGGELITTAPLRYVGAPCAPAVRERRGTFVTADYVGTGFLMISRAAIMRLIAAHPELHYTTAHVQIDAPSELLYALFDTAIDPDNHHYLSEDYAFCARWRALGGKIWLDTYTSLTHTGTHEFVGAPGMRFATG